VRAITSTDVSQWLSELDNAEATKAKALQIVRGVLDHARRDNAIRSNPVEDLASRPSPTRNARRGRALTDVELASLMAGAVEVGNPLIIVAMARMGLRIGEALGLRRGDFDTGAAILSVERSRDRDGSIRPLKGKEEGDRRTLPMPPDVVEAFLLHTTGAGPLPITGDLFITRRGTPLQYNNWRRSFWLPAVKEAGLVDVVPHDLRKTCVTRLFVVDKWSPAEVQAFVGHSDARMTLGVYARVNTQDLPVPSTFEGAL
jgi:integrase